jgi:glycosyltransferase involved in cell wall biosynthesis
LTAPDPGETHRAVVAHDFFVTEGGADHCALEFARLLPTADVVTTFFDRDQFGDRIDPDRVRTWPLQRAPALAARFRSLLPLYPLYFATMDVGPADVLLSSSIAFTHAIRLRGNGIHVSYVHTPMRYAWDLGQYLDGSSYGPVSRLAARTIRPWLQAWDRRTAGRPDVLVANSVTVQERIKRVWGRDAMVIYPPVSVDLLRETPSNDGYFLIAARLLAYRRVDLAVRACTALGVDLIIVGDGPERARLEAIAGPSIRFAGHVDRPTLNGYFERCCGYIVPGTEDFGIAPVEAMAAGKPVVAYREGGATESVIDGITGLFFDEPSADALAACISAAMATSFDSAACRARAEVFSRDRFVREWRELLLRLGVPEPLLALA